MNRPYIICHMVTSVDGKVTGDFLFRPECKKATDIYYEMNREYKSQGSGGFICGRITMETSFTGGWYPDLSKYEPVEKHLGSYMNCWCDDMGENGDYYAIAFDPKGRLGWKKNVIEDEDPGYDGARIIEVLKEKVDGRYLSYLEKMEIPYIIAGEDEINVPLALRLLFDHLTPTFYVLEGGSIINGSFIRTDCVDEISVVQAPVTADKDSKPLFLEGESVAFELKELEKRDGAVVMRYLRPSDGNVG